VSNYCFILYLLACRNMILFVLMFETLYPCYFNNIEPFV